MTFDEGASGGSWERELVVNATRRLAFAAEVLAANVDPVLQAARQVASSLSGGGKVLVCGNGGSAACAQHFAAEFTGRLSVDREPLGAIALTVDTSALTAIANDYGYQEVFARQVKALARQGDVFVGISTSGASSNVKAAVVAAKAAGVTTISLTGSDDQLGGDISIAVGLRETARVQEIHDLVLHEIAQVAERLLVADMADDPSADRFPFVLRERDITGFRAWIEQSGQTLVTTNGVFDLLHEGHRSGLQQARLHGDRLVVLVNSDESVRVLKGPDRPVRGLSDRILDLTHNPGVDHVLVMPDPDPRRLLELLRPDVHCKGNEYRNVEMPEAATVTKFGGRIAYLELSRGYSTTAQVQKIAQHND